MAAPAPGDDAAIYSRIDDLRPIAASLEVDGAVDDWGSIPVVADAAGDAGGDGSRDIVAASLALADAWLVRIETAATPSHEDLAFWLYVDYRGHERIDLELGIYLGFPDVLWTYPEDGAATFQNWDETASAIGSAVEARIPLELLAQALPTEMAEDLTGPNARPWVRITPFTRDAGELVDTGPAMASYRLIETPYDLDGPQPSAGAGSAEPAVEIRLPLAGLQYVGQGAGGTGSHAGIWGYDLFRVDGTLSPSDPPLATDNDDYFSFGESITAPAAGVVFSLENEEPDLPPLADPCAFEPPNFLFVDIGGDVGLLFSHLVQGSIPYTTGQAIPAGATIGQVGHSGSCSWPHLHLGAETIGGGFPSRPIRLLEVEVGLNPTDDDPWRRALAAWDVREGLFVRATATCSGRPAFAGLLSCDGFESGEPAPWWKIGRGAQSD